MYIARIKISPREVKKFIFSFSSSQILLFNLILFNFFLPKYKIRILTRKREKNNERQTILLQVYYHHHHGKKNVKEDIFVVYYFIFINIREE